MINPTKGKATASRIEARTCADVNGVDFSGRTVGENWKTTNRSLTSEGTTISGGGSTYTTNTPGTNNTTNSTSAFTVQDVIYGRVLYWTADYAGNGTTSSLNADNTTNYNQVTFNLNRSTTGFSLTINDIDAAAVSNNTNNANSGWIDYVRIDGYASGSTTPIALSAADITLGTNNTNAYYGQNIVYGTGNNSSTEGNVTVLFPSAVARVVITYKNAQTSQTNPGSQIIGIAGFSWCAQADVYTTLTGPGSLTATVPSGNYTVVFGNNGADNAAGVTRVVTVPANTASAVSAPSATVTGSQTAGWTLTYPAIASLGVGAGNASTYNFTITPLATGSGISVTSTVGTSTDESTTANNTTNNTATVTLTPAPAADLTTTLTGPGSLTSNLPSGNYTVTFTNNGPSTAASMVRTVTIPGTYVSSVTQSAGSQATVNGNFVLTFPAGTNVPSGNSVSYTFTITPNNNSTGQNVSATSNVAPGTGGTSQGLNTATDQATVTYTVGAVADVGVTFSSGQGNNTTVAAGTTVVYGITFSNSGPSAATDVSRTVSIPAGVPAASISAAGNINLTGNQATGYTVYYPGGTIAAANTVTYSLSFAAPATGPITLTANTSTSAGQGLNTNPDAATRTLNVTPIVLSGTVFDDVNYGGGAGRAYSAANTSATGSGFANNAIARPSATVELYDGSGNFVASTTTNAAGLYSFNLPVAGTYTTRVVNSTVTSVRTPAATGVVPVQTYVLGDANRVGGENPALTDAAANTTSATLASLSTGTVTPQSIVTRAITAAGLTGVDFGFNFDTVVNTNDVATVAGTNAQGSLRQFILNSNALANTNLNQVPASTGGNDPAAGVETSIFMITDGLTHDGLRAGLTSQLTSGVASITPAAALPALTGANSTFTTIDGATQTQNIGNTNNATLGTGGFVGAAGTTALAQLNGPEVQLVGTTAVATGLNIAASATNATIKGLAIYGFGNAIDNNTNANIVNAANNVLITQNVLGSGATAFTAPATLTNSDNVRLTTGTAGIVVSNNLIGFANGKGVAIGSGVVGVSMTGNEVNGNGQGAANMDGVDIQGRNASITNNLFTGTSGQGIDSYRSTGNNVITGNTVTDNGRGTATIAPNETPGIRIYGANNSLSQNLVFNNYGAGIMLEGVTNGGGTSAVTTTLMSQNSIYNNGNVTARNNAAATGQVGIDLGVDGDNESAGTTPFVTLNTPGSTATGANGLLNYPVLRSATISGTNLVITGYASPGATIELFTAQANPASVNATGANFGQGRTYLTTVTEGATTGVTDTDATTGISYSGNINGFNQGSDTNASGFTFTIPLSSLPGGTLAAGTVLTSTATLSSATSEFSGNVTAIAALTGYVYEDVNYGGGLGRSRTTLGAAAIGRPGAKVELYDGTGAYVATAITSSTGQYSFNVPAGTGYTVRVVNNSILSSRTGATAASGTATTGYVSNQIPVQTYNGTTGRVGGENPAYVDAAANTTSATLASLSSGTVTAQSIATVNVTTTGTNTGPDFGFNFDTVVNTGDVATVTGNNAQGSLRQFIINSNALGGETTLAPVYTATGGTTTALATGLETSIFMIPNGSAVAGQRAGLTNAAGTPNFTTPNNGAGTAATITLAAALPNVSGPATAIDGATQTRSTGDSNAAVTTAGAESTGPEVLVNVNNLATSGTGAINFTASNDQLLNMGIYGSTGNTGIGVGIISGAQFAIIQNNTINNNGANITFAGTAAGTPSTATISGNIIRDSQRGNADGIELNGNNSSMTITNNQLLRNSAFGIDFISGANSNNIITGNTFTGNGAGGGDGNAQLSGIGIRGAGSNNNTISNNTFTNNSGGGIIVKSGNTGNIFSQNTFSGNGNAASNALGFGLAIDLMAGTTGDNGDGVTKNDAGDTDTGANGLINFPIIQSATLSGNTLTVTGLARPNARVELYLAADDPTHYGEGTTYLTTITQPGSGSAIAYSGTQSNGLNQGTDTGAIPFTITYTASGSILAALQANTALLTSTATLITNDGTLAAGNFGTSEFSGNTRIFQAPVPNDVTNVSIADNTTTAVVLNPNVSATALGFTANVTTNTPNTIINYTINPPSTGGVLYYQSTPVTASIVVPAANISQLTFVPTRGFVGNVTFTYTTLDNNGLSSTSHNNGGTITSGPATYTIPVTASADVAASITGGTTLTAGQPTGYYTAAFTNLGPDVANSVTQQVTLPTGATLTTAQRTAITNAYSGTTFTTTGTGNSAVTTINFLTASTLASGLTNSFRFAFTAPALPGSSTLTATTSTTSSEGINQAPDQASLALTTGALTDVTATITPTSTSVAPGATATFTATFTNTSSTQPADGVVETVQIIPNLTATTLTVSGQTGTLGGSVITFADGSTYNVNTGLVTLAPTSLAASGSNSAAIAFTMPTNGTVVGTASITTTTPETSTTNNVQSASITAAPRFDLATTLYGPSTVVAGSPVTLNVTTINNGPQAVSGAVQTVTIPAGLNVTGATPSVFISNGGTYDNATGVVTFPALGNLPTNQMVGNTITFLSPTAAFAPSAAVTPNSTGAGDTNTGNNLAYLNGAATSTTLTPGTASGTAANVYAILSTTSNIVNSSTQVVYATGVGNAGPGTASTVTGQLQLMPGLGVAGVTVAGATGTLQSNNININFADGTNYKNVTYNNQTGLLTYAVTAAAMPSGSTISFNVGVTVPAAVGNNGQLLATNSIGSLSPDNVPADNVKAVAVTVRPTADLVTTLTGPSAGVTPGQSVTYTATFTNNGPSAASVVAETVQLPANLTITTLTVAGQTGSLASGVISFANGAKYTVATGLLTLPALATDAVGAVQSFVLTFAAPAQSYVVSSAISSATPEAALANNAASVATTMTQTADVAVMVAGPATAVVGNPVTYTVMTTNNGPVTATNVVPTLLLPTGLTILSSGAGSPTYDTNTGLLTFPALTTLQAGVSAENYVTFTMPSPAAGQLSVTASVASDSYDNVASNNTAGLTTSLAPTTNTTADLLTTITPTTSTVTPNSTVNYTVNYRNAGAATATGVVATATLPTGIGASLLVANGNGTLSANTGLYGFSNGATYDPTTGLLTLPLTSLAPSTTNTSYTFSFPAPASGSLVVNSAINSTLTESNTTNNRDLSTVTITPASDLSAAITGPTSALAGVPNVYTATFSNVGVSPAASVTPTVQLPANLTIATLLVAGQTGTAGTGVITYPNGASYNTTSGLLTFATIGSLAPGTANAASTSFTVTMPTAGTSLTATASYTAASIPTSDTNTANNSASITTNNAPLSLAPVAENIVNALQSARGNTSNTNLALTPLFATDADGTIANYFIQSLPTSGTLYYNNVAITSIPTNGFSVANPALVSYKPATGYVGNAFFTYTATDNSGVVSNTALYTIPVAQDQSTTYAVYNTSKGGANPYLTGDVLAQVTDPNTAVYNNAGLIYNAATGVQQASTSNGLNTTGTNATIVSGTLPTGVSLDAATGRIYVSNAAALPLVRTATTYPITVQTIDLNGGVNQVPVTITIGAFPLPVQFTAFTAQAVQNRDALLTWTTATELNNDHFDLERSLDGTTFVKVTQVAGQGSKLTPTDYRFTDAGIGTSVAAGQPVYYRLQQVDTDGTATYSPVRTVSFTAQASASVALSLFPNPAASATSLDLRQLPATATYDVQLLDATGRTVRRTALAGGRAQPLDLSSLAAGTYHVLVTGQQANGAALRQVLRLTKE